MFWRCRRDSLLLLSGLAWLLESLLPSLPHCVVESLLVDKRGCEGVGALCTVGDVAGGVTLDVMIVGGGKACVLVSAVVVDVDVPMPELVTSGPLSEAVDEVEGLCSCL